VSKPLHIGLIAQGGAGWAGGTEYIRNLTRAIAAADPPVRVSIVCSRAQQPEWSSHGSLVVVPPARKSWLSRFQEPNRHFTDAVNEAAIDFLYPLTYDNQYNVGVTLPLGRSLHARWAGWIPDFQHRALPQLFTPKEISRRDRGIDQLVAAAPKIVFSSETAAAEFRSFFPPAAQKAEVLTFATFPQAEWFSGDCGEDLHWLPERFFIVSNQFWKHKNHTTLFEALQLLAARDVRPIVVCTGRLADFRDADYADTILQSLHRFGIAQQVVLLGMIARGTQIELMRRSLAVVQPSLFEGWSTVVEDVRVLGKPVILSDIAVHQEQNPPGARFFPRDSAAALADSLEEAWRTLTPGPHLESEAAARTRAEQRITEVGRRFLEIARAS
jgi:glycosyltransferase involved in cell wall biosynthesis